MFNESDPASGLATDYRARAKYAQAAIARPSLKFLYARPGDKVCVLLLSYALA
jgi:hypothetical protein